MSESTDDESWLAEEPNDGGWRLSFQLSPAELQLWETLGLSRRTADAKGR